MVHISNINTLKSIYFHSTIKYGIILWGYSSNSGKIFTLQKKIITIMAVAKHKPSCRSLFKQLEILPVPCQYILSFMSFIINNQEIFQTNSPINNINTSNKHHLHGPKTNQSCFKKKSTFYVGIKIFNSLQPSVTILKNDKAKFKAAVRKCLHTHPFNSVDELCVNMIYNIVTVIRLLYFTP
jgi:hypothetical protein